MSVTLHEFPYKARSTHLVHEPRARLVTNRILQDLDIFAIPGFIW